MTGQRRRYRTRQREAVFAYLVRNGERYLSVDDVWSGVSSEGAEVVVTGRFETYTEGDVNYVHLVDASLEAA